MSKNRILIIDDEKDLCFFLKANLEARGNYVVKVASSGEDGLYLAERFKPHLIILDIMMPVMDGFQAARKIRSLERSDAETVPIIAMTADAFEESLKSAKEAGMNDYLTKPVEPDKLYETLAKYL